MKVNYWHSEGWPEKSGSYELAGISITSAKKHLKEKGGTACACHFDRNLNLVKKTEITLEKKDGN
jgi:hypothetical protein